MEAVGTNVFEEAPLYIPHDIRKMILAFSAPIHVYLGCVIEDQTYIHVLGVFRLFRHAEKRGLVHKSAKGRIYHILKIQEGEVLADKMRTRLFSPARLPRYWAPLYRLHPLIFNEFGTFLLELFYRKLLRNELPSPLENGESVFIDETEPYFYGKGGVRKFVLTLDSASQKRLEFYTKIESTWKVRIHPKGGGVPRPSKFFVE